MNRTQEKKLKELAGVHNLLYRLGFRFMDYKKLHDPLDYFIGYICQPIKTCQITNN